MKRNPFRSIIPKENALYIPAFVLFRLGKERLCGPEAVDFICAHIDAAFLAARPKCPAQATFPQPVWQHWFQCIARFLWAMGYVRRFTGGFADKGVLGGREASARMLYLFHFGWETAPLPCQKPPLI